MTRPQLTIRTHIRAGLNDQTLDNMGGTGTPSQCGPPADDGGTTTGGGTDIMLQGSGLDVNAT